MERTLFKSYPISPFKIWGDGSAESGNVFAPWSQLIEDFILPVTVYPLRKETPWKSNPTCLNSPWIKSQQERKRAQEASQPTGGLCLNWVILDDIYPRHTGPYSLL